LKDIFISYAHEDRETAQRLASLLKSSGLTVWWDPQLRAGQDFALEIERILQQVSCVIVLWSSHSVDSRWVRAEANEGVRLGKLVPVALDDSTPPLVFRAIHTAQIPADELAADSANVQKLISDIQAMLGQPARATTEADNPPSPASYPWRYPAVIAGAVFVALFIMAVSDLPAFLLDGLAGKAAASPLGISPMATEATLMAAASTLLLLGGWRLYIGRFKNRKWITLVTLAALISATCVYTWSVRLIKSAPDHLSGNVNTTEWNDMRIEALGALGQSISLGAVPVSTENGGFGMRLLSAFADRPRMLRLMKPGCADITAPLPWQQWKNREPIIIDFQCNPQP